MFAPLVYVNLNGPRGATVQSTDVRFAALGIVAVAPDLAMVSRALSPATPIDPSSVGRVGLHRTRYGRRCRDSVLPQSTS